MPISGNIIVQEGGIYCRIANNDKDGREKAWIQFACIERTPCQFEKRKR